MWRFKLNLFYKFMEQTDTIIDDVGFEELSNFMRLLPKWTKGNGYVAIRSREKRNKWKYYSKYGYELFEILNQTKKI